MGSLPDSWPRIREAFEGALALPLAERDAYLTTACGGDEHLRLDVERMLASHERAGGFLVAPPVLVDESTTHLEGRRIGPYLLLSRIGAGGMGEVYKARDTRLDRTVAIKVVAPHVARDPNSHRRFGIEARAAAGLNHPHICTLYDVGHEPSTDSEPSIDYLVMEYLEGETLAARLTKGPIPLVPAGRYAIQIASALGWLHRAGIVHRDLKPGNVMLTKTGAKLLDFGLAKPSSEPSGRDATTRVEALTVPGMILGTVHYMAPEQIEGGLLDARSDIFAFGSLLYEMLSGRKAFEGSSHAAVMAAIVEHPAPRLSTLLPQVPRVIEGIIDRCLAKDPDERWQSARDVMFQLEAMTETTPTVTAGRRRREWTKWGLAAAFGLALAAALLLRPPAAVPIQPVSRLSIPPPEGTTFIGGYGAPHLALSQDGRRLAFVPTPKGGRTLLWIRDMNSVTARPLPGTDGATYPFWSPDDRSIGFFADGKLKIVASAGGVPQAIADAPDPRGGAWGDDVIVFAPQLDGPLHRVSVGGGPQTVITRLDESRQEVSHRLPSFLPDGRHFLYMVQSGRLDNSVLLTGSIDSPETRRLNIRGSKAVYADGFVVFARDQALMAQRFDPTTLQLSGDPVPLGDQVSFRISVYGDALFSVSGNGTLVYWNGGPSVTRLTWFDRKGAPGGSVGKTSDYLSVALAPDERTIAAELIDPATQVGDIWAIDAGTGIGSRLTVHPGWDFGPVWSPDGSAIVFGSVRERHQSLYRATTRGNGSDELLLTSSDALGPSDWPSKTGLVVLQNITQFKVGTVSVEGKNPVTFPSPFAEADGRLSPDGRWLAYTSNESGAWDIYVRSFPALDQKWRVSPEGGSRPMWRQDGRELFYMAADQTLMATPVDPGAAFKAGIPKPLFPLRTIPVPPTQPRRQYAVASSGDRFLVNTVVEPLVPVPVTVALNWREALSTR